MHYLSQRFLYLAFKTGGKMCPCIVAAQGGKQACMHMNNSYIFTYM